MHDMLLATKSRHFAGNTKGAILLQARKVSLIGNMDGDC